MEGGETEKASSAVTEMHICAWRALTQKWL